LVINEKKCIHTDDSFNKNFGIVRFYGVNLSKGGYPEGGSIAEELVHEARLQRQRVMKMLRTGAPRSAIFQIWRYNIIPRLNYSAFFDQLSEEYREHYLYIDIEIMNMFVLITNPKDTKYALNLDIDNAAKTDLLDVETYAEINELLTIDAEKGGLNLILPGMFYSWLLQRKGDIEKEDSEETKKKWR